MGPFDTSNNVKEPMERLTPEWANQVKTRQFEHMFHQAKIDGKTTHPAEIYPDRVNAIIGRAHYQWDDYFFTWIKIG